MRNTIITLLYTIPGFAWAGFIPPYTIVNTSYEYDVQPNGGYSRTFERLIRIDTPQGIDQYGQAKVYYDGKRNKLDIVEAYTIRPNGEKVPVSPERIKRVNAESEDEAPYFSDQMTAVIIFPQVEVGSQLYHKTVLEEADPIIKNRFGAMIAFTPHRRYENASIKLTHPSDIGIQAFSRDVPGNKSILSDGRVQYTYQYKQNTAFPLEPNQVIYEDFAPVVQFSNYDGYADLAKVTQALFQPKTKVTPNIQRLADTITADSRTQRDKAQKLYDWVSKNIRYVGIDVGASGFEPHFADEILEHMYGDCKDHAVILESLLLAVGINSSPALINTLDSYKLPMLAGKYYFNHVITYVPGLNLFLDSTAQFAEFGTLPAEIMGKLTLITQSGEVQTTPYSSPKTDYTVTHVKLNLLPDGSITGKTEYKPHGYFTTASRTSQYTYEDKETQTVVDSLLKRFQETGSGDLEHSDPTDLAKQWVVRSNYKLDPVINLPGPSAMTVPTGLSPGYIRLASSTKPYDDRRYPYSCGSSKHIEFIELSFPSKTTISRIPHGLSAATNEQSYKSTYKLEGNKLLITREKIVDLHTDVCIPTKKRSRDLLYIQNKIKFDLRDQIFID